MAALPAMAIAAGLDARLGAAAPVWSSVSLCVHLGMTKTGTKTLQCHLFPQHSQVEYLGKFIPGSERYPGRRHRDSGVKQIMTQLLDGGALRPDLDLARRLAREGLGAAAAGRRVMVWSAEELCKGPAALHRARAENLRAVFGACRITITLRHPVKHVESEYLQSVKIAHVGRRWDRYKKIGLFDVPTRLAELWSKGEEDDLSKLLYAGTIAAYREVFGREAIGVFLFEELQSDPRRYVSRLCEFLGIDAGEGWALCQGRRENDRWTVDQFRRLRKLERSWWRRAIFQRASLRWRRRLLGLDAETGEPSRAAPKVEVEVPRDWRKRIEDLTCEGNRWLAKEWGLPMADYGYPL